MAFNGAESPRSRSNMYCVSGITASVNRRASGSGLPVPDNDVSLAEPGVTRAAAAAVAPVPSRKERRDAVMARIVGALDQRRRTASETCQALDSIANYVLGDCWPRGLVVAAGGLLQGLIGFGLALVAVPLLALLDPTLLPVPVLMVATAHASMSLAREFSHVDWRGVGWAMLGRLPGTVVGMLDRRLARPEGLRAGRRRLGAGVRAAVRSRPGARNPRRSRWSRPGSRAGRSARRRRSVGRWSRCSTRTRRGRRSGRRWRRSSCSAPARRSSACSSPVRSAARQLWTGLALVPFLVAGFLLSGPLRKKIDASGIRTPMLVVAGTSAVVLIVRSLLS